MYGECLNVVEFKSTENARGKKSIFVYFHLQHKSSCYIFHGPKTTAQKIQIYPKIFYINFKQR